jgi:hypothetical protein
LNNHNKLVISLSPYSNIFTTTVHNKDALLKNSHLPKQITWVESALIHQSLVLTLELPTYLKDLHTAGLRRNFLEISLFLTLRLLLPLPIQLLLPQPASSVNPTTLPMAFSLLLNGELRLSRLVVKAAPLRVFHKQITVIQSVLLILMRASLTGKQQASNKLLHEFNY